MKRLLFAALLAVAALTAKAQGPQRPFEIDEAFVPALGFMQKAWSGQYDGLEMNSRRILSISRSLKLLPDMTYTNETTCAIEQGGRTVTLKHETGTYQYDEATGLLTYSLATDSTLDINDYLQGKEPTYTVMDYAALGTGTSYQEQAQFTFADGDGTRQWVLFDQKLMSPVDQSRQAVYVMNGTAIDPAGLAPLPVARPARATGAYSLDGRRVSAPRRGIYVVDGKKIEGDRRR